jgi:dinuclear metal center YbgI/SA1388 family protein
MKREQLVEYLDGLLQPAKFRDYCPNGLQVEGRADVGRIIAGVTASQALLDVAVARGADAILVHHGYFWKGEDGRITGIRRQRLKTLLAHDISLLAYHLPLDAHPELGNNAQLAARLGWLPDGRFGEQDIAWLGSVGEPTTAAQLCDQLAAEPGAHAHADRRCRSARCAASAGARGAPRAISSRRSRFGVDAFVSGEISEQTVHLARESGVAFLACGHHATERYGVAALAEHLTRHCGLQCEFVDLDNPV